MNTKSIACLLLFAMQTLPSLAALGSAPNPSSVRTNSYSGYSINEIALASGTRVREYVSANNVVFGVSWQGPSIPDLAQVLGASVDRISANANVADSGRVLDIKSGDFVLHSAGHMRYFRGIAYIPSLIPAGLATDEIN